MGYQQSNFITLFTSLAISTAALILFWKEKQRAQELQSQIERLRKINANKNNDGDEHVEKIKPRESQEEKNVDAEPKYYVLHVHSPDMVDLPSDKVEDEWEMFSAPSKSQDMVKVHLHFLLVHVLNRMIRQQTVPREAIHMVADPRTSSTSIQIVLDGQHLQDVASRFQKLGVGKSVGMMYASPITPGVVHIPEPGSLPSDSEESKLIVAQPHVVRRLSSMMIPPQLQQGGDRTSSFSRQGSTMSVGDISGGDASSYYGGNSTADAGYNSRASLGTANSVFAAAAAAVAAGLDDFDSDNDEDLLQLQKTYRGIMRRSMAQEP